MGIQIHAEDNYRRVVEIIQSGAIGPVREVHVWVSRAWGWQSEEAAKRNGDIVFVQDRPKEAMPVPAGLHWDLWLGPARERPFHDVYFPGPKWYRWWDFGNGTMSDLGSHFNDLPFWALKLQYPLTIEGSGPPPHPEIAPASMQATYEFGARGDLPPVRMTWYQGENKPEIWTQKGIPQWGDGHPVHRRQGHAAVRLRQIRAAARGRLRRLPAARAVAATRHVASCRVARSLPQRHAVQRQLRVRRLVDRIEPPGQRRLPRRQEARVGSRAVERPPTRRKPIALIRVPYRAGWEW